MQMSNKQIRIRKIDIDFAQTGLHGLEAFFAVQSGIND
jgi:hypothetical protein